MLSKRLFGYTFVFVVIIALGGGIYLKIAGRDRPDDEGSDDAPADNPNVSATRTFATDVAGVTVPESLATQWADVAPSATDMADAAAAMFTGFIDPESSAGRRQGHDDLKTAGDAIQTALTAVATAAAGS